MARLKPIKPEHAKGELGELYSTIEKGMGKVPNIFQYMGNSPLAVKAYLNLAAALEKSSFSKEERELIALAVSEANHCNYCLAAHSALGKAAGVKEKNLLDARHWKGESPRVTTVLQFSKKYVDKKGFVSDEDFRQLKDAGLSDKEVVDLFLIVMATMFTNYFNHLNETPVDFPAVTEAAVR